MPAEWLVTAVNSEHEKRFKVMLSRGTVLIYVRHPTHRSATASPGEQETHAVYITKLNEFALTYEDFKRIQLAINLVSCVVEETKPMFKALMEDSSKAINVY